MEDSIESTMLPNRRFMEPFLLSPSLRNQLDPWRSFFRNRWDSGIHNAYQLFLGARTRGYEG
jgi:hypothetical protein